MSFSIAHYARTVFQCLEENEKMRGLQYGTCIQPEDLANYMGNEVNNEVLTFPTLFPDGKFGFDIQSTQKLTLRKYFQARLLSEDTRFTRNTEYLFYAHYLTEQKQVSDNINIALRKTKVSASEDTLIHSTIFH